MGYFNMFYQKTKLLILEWNDCLRFLDLQMLKLVSNLKKCVIFSHLKFVGRVSETQLQVGENLNYLIQRFKV